MNNDLSTAANKTLAIESDPKAISISSIEMDMVSVVYELYDDYHKCNTEKFQREFLARVSELYLPELLVLDSMICRDDECFLKEYFAAKTRFEGISEELDLEFREELMGLFSESRDLNYVYRRMLMFLESRRGCF